MSSRGAKKLPLLFGRFKENRNSTENYKIHQIEILIAKNIRFREFSGLIFKLV